MVTYAINGKFAGERITGMQRYAYEVVRELDKIVLPGEFVIVVPDDATNLPELQTIEVVGLGGEAGIPWEQRTLAQWLSKSGLPCMNLLNTVPLGYPRGLLVVHDISYKVNPQFFTGRRDRISRYWHVLNFSKGIRSADRLATVSMFSRSEISRVYGIDQDKIVVAPNAWQHMLRIEASRDALQKYGLEAGNYFFSMSSVARNKNFGWIARVARRNPERTFAIAGGGSLNSYFEESGIQQPKNLIFLGYVTDGEAKALMEGCRAFLFPTFYEGFGIPPMEALACGTQIVISDTDVMHEIYGASAHYVNPNDYEVNLDDLLCCPVAPSSEVLKQYSWSKTARTILDVVTKNY